MTELTQKETQALLAGPTRWTMIRNWWKNLSRFWSPREQRLQRELNRIHNGIDDLIEKEVP